MIFVTGDTHGLVDFQKLADFAKNNPNLTKKDIVIIAGDCGICFLPKNLETNIKTYSMLPFTIAFIDGNHENFDMLNSFPIEIWNGGRTHKIEDSIYHLIRGEIFNIEGKNFFCFGGATSIDKAFRIENYSWWKEELPTIDDLDNAYNNLQKYNYNVDYVITHSCDTKTLYYPIMKKNLSSFNIFPENQILENFEELTKYKHWYFGHYHFDADIITDKKTILYNNIVKIK